MTTVRRCTAALAASAVLCVAFAPAAAAGGDRSPAPAPAEARTPAAGASTMQADPSSDTASGAATTIVIPPGLYGDKDPTQDGVWRQSLSMLGQAAAQVRPGDQAVIWLKSQQCASGAFPAFRADPSVPCDEKTAVDARSTAAAIQALSSLGEQQLPMDHGVSWLRSVQNADGGWGRRPGTPSDATSTSLVIGALTAAGVRPSSVRTHNNAPSPEGKHAFDALVRLSIPCGAASGADAGAFAYRPDASGLLTADDAATAAAVLAGVGKRMVTSPVAPGTTPVCENTKGTETDPAADLPPERAARNGASYLAAALASTGHLDQPQAPGTDSAESADGGDSVPVPSAPPADIGNTAAAVVALTTTGYGDRANIALEWLKQNCGAWAQANGPAAYAQLIFAAHATGTDPRNFGGIDLVQRLNETGPAPKYISPAPAPGTAAGTGAAAGTSGGAAATAAAESALSGADGRGVLWLVGIALAGGIGIGYLLGNRRKTSRP
ncbi:prenyltransferase/squalene oxidase repeat-containing protein [Streptomyces sp. NBC_01429]|uniref:prenyltransferase/squalene oxidase repeat-containing protein n=1 Tax=Streptomyces sp. NBC_01429 TaxID=2903862 RepID=UPI002E292228|nr:prenyltransferase/squalene oxidase repeat-containing protein [Streptomyces sp. NBC_01429]